MYKPPAEGPDLILISELLETIEQNPSAIEPRHILMQQYLQAGWKEEASNIAAQMRRIDPAEAGKLLGVIDDEQTLKSPSTPLEEKTDKKSTELPQSASKLARAKTPTNVIETQEKAVEECTLLRERAAIFFKHVKRLDMSGLYDEKRDTWASIVQGLEDLAEGRFTAVIPPDERPPAVRALARAMELAEPATRIDLLVDDLKRTVRWLRLQDDDANTVQDAIDKRVGLLRAALPQDMEHYAATAMMHLAHEELGKIYVNDETMYGDPVVDIPRDRFLVTEDGYAWDMDELPKAISANSAVMRNPLSRQLFSETDVRSILQHPLGSHLAAATVVQSQLVRGVREATTTKIRELAETLLKDMSMDQQQSRVGMDQFRAYIATLPGEEQTALEQLRVPATDSHTRQPFDFSILEAVRDAAGNRTCTHKVGDYLKQAASHLQSQQAAVSDSSN